MIAYYALLWSSAALNLAWCSLQAWQCDPSKVVAWNLLSLVTSSAMLCLEISLVIFLLREDYTCGRVGLKRTFVVSGIFVGVDALLKAIYVFGFGIPLYKYSDGIYDIRRVRWALWIIHKLLLVAVYGFVLYVYISKWREKLPRLAFYKYIIIMLVASATTLFACGIAGSGFGFGLWLYSLTLICYHALYLPHIYVTFLVDFFQVMFLS